MNISEIKARLEEIDIERNALNSERVNLYDQLRNECPHENIEILRGYNRSCGMADDRARSGYYERKVCHDCGKYLAERTESPTVMSDWYEY